MIGPDVQNTTLPNKGGDMKRAMLKQLVLAKAKKR